MYHEKASQGSSRCCGVRGDEPGRGGKRTARRPRKISTEHIRLCDVHFGWMKQTTGKGILSGEELVSKLKSREAGGCTVELLKRCTATVEQWP